MTDEERNALYERLRKALAVLNPEQMGTVMNFALKLKTQQNQPVYEDFHQTG